MDNLLLGLRVQDIYEGLRVTGAFGPKDTQYERTLLIGKAASLAMHLRGLLYVTDVTQLKYAAASLDISSLELPAVLRELEEVDFVTIVQTGSQIKRIDLRIPEFRSGYSDLGSRWTLLKPSDIEIASVNLLNDLYRGPAPEAKLHSSIGLKAPQLAIMKDVMQSGHLISVEPVDGVPTVFTPFAVDGNPTAYLQWAKKFPSEVGAALETLGSRQGLPLSDPAIKSNKALGEAIRTGVVLPVQIQGATGAQRFVFAPRGGLAPEERTILDKARAIVACVRYGQNFAAGRPIKYPRRIVETLRDNKRFKKGHPDLFSQYGILVEKLIGHPVDEGGGRWNFAVDDSKENMKAFQIAIEMLEYGESPSTRINLEAQRALLAPSGYVGPPATRSRMSTSIEASAATRTEIIKQMANLARGMQASS